MKLRTLSRLTLGLATVSGLAAVVACSSGDASSSTTDNTPAAAVGTAATAETAEANPLDRPSWATAERLTGMVDDTEPVSIQVHLKLHNYQDAVDELYAVSDPTKSTYGQFLTDEEFNTKYAPTADDVAVVRAHLEAHGLQITEVPDNNMYIQAQGTAAQVKSAFSSRLGHYNVSGVQRRGPVDQPSLPAGILSRVGGVLGLSDSVKLAPHNIRSGSVQSINGTTTLLDPNHTATDGGTADAGAGTAAPPTACSQFWNQNTATVEPAYGKDYPATTSSFLCGYTPPQIRGAYGTDSLVSKKTDGTGVTVAIIDAFQSPTLLADAQKYALAHDPSHPLLSSQFTAVTGPATQNPEPPVDTGWYGEQTLDVEAIHASAPGANIVYMAAASPTDQDLTAAMNVIISKRLATMISNSYGSPEGQANDFVVWQQTVLHAGLKGIGVYFSSGDSGDFNSFANPSDNLGQVSASFPASLPHVTAVGGTSLAIDSSNGYVFETGWATSYSILAPELLDGGAIPTDDAGNPLDGGPTQEAWSPAAPGQFGGGAGGGVSLVYTQPRYQKALVPSALANEPGAPARVVPDVATLADPYTGFLIGETDPTSGVYSESAIGGTSLACPLFVGIMALSQQNAGHTLGFANAQLYALKSTAWRDIVSSKTPEAVNLIGPHVTAVVTLGYHGETIDTAAGYDTITGLGTPNGSTFVKAMK
jgi:subtilase family serine protease